MPLAVIIPCYKADEYLPDTLKALFSQSHMPREVILFNDGSGETVMRFIGSLHVPDGCVVRELRHANNENRGQFITRIEAAKQCNSTTLAFLDADDLWDRSYLERQLFHWEECTRRNAVMAYCPSFFWYGGANQRNRLQSLPSRGAGLYSAGELLDSFIDTLYDCTPCPSCMIVDRDVFLSLERFALSGRDALGYEDQIVSWYIALHHPVYVHDEVLVRYRQSDNSSSKVTQASKDRATKAELSFIDTIIPEIERVNRDATALSKLKDRRSHLMKQNPPPTWRQRMTSFLGLANK